MGLLAGLLCSSDPNLQAAAAAVLHEVVSKRMEPAAKLAMLQVCQLTPVPRLHLLFVCMTQQSNKCALYHCIACSAAALFAVA